MSTVGANANISIDSGGKGFGCHFRGSAENSSSGNRSIAFPSYGCSTSKGGNSGAAIDNLDSGSWDMWLLSYDGQHSHGVTQSNHSHTINAFNTNYNGNSNDTESRPDNLTIKIWKRVS